MPPTVSAIGTIVVPALQMREPYWVEYASPPPYKIHITQNLRKEPRLERGSFGCGSFGRDGILLTGVLIQKKAQTDAHRGGGCVTTRLALEGCICKPRGTKGHPDKREERCGLGRD